MDNLRAKSKILVTGGSGYLASWVVRQLLDEGHSVNATVRSLADSVKVSHLSEMEKEFPGKLRVFEADLTENGSFDQPASGCEIVIHTASPFKISGIRDAVKELTEPAVNGVRNVFGAAVRSGTVRRVVLTSSVAAVFGDAFDL